VSLADDLALAIAATRAAGEVAMRHFRQAPKQWEKGPGQVVTEADVAVDRLLHERLLGANPGDGWLSEESEDGPARLGRSRVWIVDPIDGTRSFAEGVPSSRSAWRWSRRAPVVGVVLNPATDELFAAVRGGGASLNGVPIRATARDRLEGATIVASRFESRRRRFPDLLPSVEVTTIGSLAYKLALVASGRYDGYLSWRRTHDWDIAGAAVILAEAGALLTDADGLPIALNRERPVHEGLLAGARRCTRCCSTPPAPAGPGMWRGAVLAREQARVARSSGMRGRVRPRSQAGRR
jgi:myo-inositol-1(or 4)-monophosphatase